MKLCLSVISMKKKSEAAEVSGKILNGKKKAFVFGFLLKQKKRKLDFDLSSPLNGSDWKHSFFLTSEHISRYKKTLISKSYCVGVCNHMPLLKWSVISKTHTQIS